MPDPTNDTIGIEEIEEDTEKIEFVPGVIPIEEEGAADNVSYMGDFVKIAEINLELPQSSPEVPLGESYFGNWLKGKSMIGDPEISIIKGVLVSFEIKLPLYQADKILVKNHDKEYIQHHEFLDKIRSFLNEDSRYFEEWNVPSFMSGTVLTKDGIKAAAESPYLKNPPNSVYPIYIFLLKHPKHGTLISYLGKTWDTKRGRHYDGHKASIKLHDPIWDEFEKEIHLGRIILTDEDGVPRLPAEALGLDRFHDLIWDVESYCIYNLSNDVVRQCFLNKASAEKEYTLRIETLKQGSLTLVCEDYVYDYHF